MVRTGVRLGIDVGTVRAGLAASDPSGLLASPVETVPRDLTAQRADLARIAAVAPDLEDRAIMVGLPRHLSGAEGKAAKLAREYAADVARLVDPLPVRLVD